MATVVSITTKKCTDSKRNLNELEVMIQTIRPYHWWEGSKEKVVECFNLMNDGSCNYNGKCRYHPTRYERVR